MKENQIKINLIVNLYPFENKLLEGDVSFEEMIENIDIGGPSMLRYLQKLQTCNRTTFSKYYDEFLKELNKKVRHT